MVADKPYPDFFRDQRLKVSEIAANRRKVPTCTKSLLEELKTFSCRPSFVVEHLLQGLWRPAVECKSGK